jgi:hypothetical protein
LFLPTVLRFTKNKRVIIQSCRNFIHHAESDSGNNACEDILIRYITRYIDENKDYISAQNESEPDFRLVVFGILSKVCFDTIYNGAGSYYYSIRHVYKDVMNEMLEYGYITQNEYDDSFTSLNVRIKERNKQAIDRYIRSRHA